MDGDLAITTYVLDGSAADDAAGIYRQLAAMFHFPPYFGRNPDALWDSLTELVTEPTEILWINSARSAERLGTSYVEILAVLNKATDAGILKLRLL